MAAEDKHKQQHVNLGPPKGSDILRGVGKAGRGNFLRKDWFFVYESGHLYPRTL